MAKGISSTKNILIKDLLILKSKSRSRRSAGKFLIEGLREISLALKGGYKIDIVLIDRSIIQDDQLPEFLGDLEQIDISNEVYKKLAFRDSTEGIIAVCHTKNLALQSLTFKSKNPLILVAESIEKPGNIGALLRTADAAGIDAVLIADPLTDMYNPNIIRSSVGCVFTTAIGLGTSEEIIAFLKNQKINIFTASLNASEPYTKADFTQGAAIVVGTEATGLSDTWLAQSDQNIIIPMRGAIDSMNVSVSAAVLIFEAIRQRNTNN